jgi:cation diffusion facilitator family transporter
MIMSVETPSVATQEKTQVALSSVFAALALTGLKIIVGIITGSLGILAEAAHSALDLVAAIVTWLAVRTSGKPADQEHLYGHGKIENLSALFETFLLLLTCVWIIYEAVQRLFIKEVEVDASIWAFLVMIVSIVIDISRSRALYRAARKHRSQALEADALHFSTDIWSSSVVILGLIAVRIGNAFPQAEFLILADPIAALGVAAIVIVVGLRLGIRTVRALLDTAPAGVSERIKAQVEAIPGVLDCHRIRVRPSGPDYFVDVHVLLKGSLSLIEAHALTETIENSIQEILPHTDVTVHPEPLSTHRKPKRTAEDPPRE